MEEFGVLIAFGVMVLVPLIGVCMILTAGGLAERRKRHGGTLSSARLVALGFSVIVMSLVAFMAVCLQVPDQIKQEPIDPISIAALILAGSLALSVGYCGWLVLRLRAALSQPRTIENDAQFSDRLTWVRLAGWVLVLLPIGVFSPVMITFALPIALVSLSTMAILINNARARQGNLMWLLAISVERNIPLPDEIESFASTLWGQSRRRMLELADRLHDGDGLGESLEELPGLVPSYAVTAAFVGEQTGNLKEMLRECAVKHTQSMQQASTRTPVIWLLVYFWALITLMQLLVTFQLYYIVPKFKAIFNGFGVELPAITKMLIAAADSIVANFFLIAPIVSLPTVIAALVGIHALESSALLSQLFFPRRIRSLSDYIVPKLARNLTNIFPRVDSPWILRCIAFAIGKGRPLTDVLAVLSLHHHRETVRERIANVELAVADGEDSWLTMQSQNLINAHELALLQSAQRVGNLPWAMQELADTIERRQQYRLAYWVELLRPVVVIAVGAIVAFICVALFMPLVQLLNDLS